jgi:hypothetical protein
VQEDGSTVVLDPTATGNSGNDWDQPGGDDSSTGSSTTSGSNGSTTSTSGSGSSGSSTQTQQPGASQSGPAGESSSGTSSQAQPAPVVAGEPDAGGRLMHRLHRAMQRAPRR